jgi:predicted nucleic acid-binding protein
LGRLSVPAPRPAALLLDANVLIDFWLADRTVLPIISAGIAPLRIPLPVLREEVDPAATEDWLSLGVVSVEPATELVARAGVRRPGLSFHDRICLLLAKENGWTCVTNDRRLRRDCDKERVPVRWGLELVIECVRGGLLSAGAAESIGRALRSASPTFFTQAIFDEFRAAISGTPAARSPRKRR